MEYRQLGKSELKVPVIGLGSDTFGRDIDEQTTAQIIDHALSLGVNYIDTADVYGWGGWAERYVGLAVKGKRSRFIIATKFGVKVSEDLAQGTSQEGLGSRKYITQAVEASLKRLNTDYIDLYQFHMPDPTTPVEETLRALDDLVRAGKVRYIGCSNFSGWELCEALWVSKAAGLNSFVSIQPRYSLLDRHIEEELIPCCQAYNVGVIPWYPLAGGFLTGKYRRGAAIPEGTRFSSNPAMYGRMLNDANFDLLEKLEAFAAERNHSMAELAIAWLASHQWCSTVIAGVTSKAQVSANVNAAEWKLSAEEMVKLDQATGYKIYSVFQIGPRKYSLPPGYLSKGKPGLDSKQ
jgi:aryl-alcohol dehydrogenase-like predicted oxidoreductase